MAYLELIHQLFNINLQKGVKLGLQNAQRLQHFLKFPDHSFSSIHVAGTNGKGSVCIKMAHAFELAGYKVGLYTSPHISCFRERIRINGNMIPEEIVETLLLFLFKMIKKEKIPATFFEITTLLAFQYFAQEKVDVAIIETGLGGRLDATNIITPCLSIITSISLDHTEILGSTVELIANEKAGIIKDNIPVIIGPKVPLETIMQTALEKNSLCLQIDQIESKRSSALYEEENRSIAHAALEHLTSNFKLPLQAIKLGLEAKLPCRFEIIQGSPTIILDVAHNPEGICRLFHDIAHHFSSQPLRLLFGFSKNKDLTECIKQIAKLGSNFHLIKSGNERGASIQILGDHLQNHGIDSSHIFYHDTIKEGVMKSREEALKDHQILVIFGTFFIMGEVRQALGYKETQDRIDLN